MKLKDYQVIVDLTSKALKIPSIKVRIKNVNGGRANKNYITLPKWLDNYDAYYQIYYTVHETCHYVEKRRKHNLLFKECEDRMLALWGIRIIRKKAYPKALYANGKRIKSILK